MAQEQIQGQEQRLEQQLKQTQTITHQQLLQAMLTELPSYTNVSMRRWMTIRPWKSLPKTR